MSERMTRGLWVLMGSLILYHSSLVGKISHLLSPSPGVSPLETSSTRANRSATWRVGCWVADGAAEAMAVRRARAVEMLKVFIFAD